jgi:regulator of sigma E protease
MDIFIKAAQLLLSLSILVILHEFGHYIPARLFKIKVEKFYLFFAPWFSLFKKKIGDTEWGIGWLPLGGYVKIAGMVDESMDSEQLAQPAQPWEFRSKPAWQRLIVMLGGVFVNVVVGIIIYICVVFAYGDEKLNPNDVEVGLSVHPYLEKYGLVSGDNIVGLDGEKVTDIQEINSEIFLRGKRKLSVIKEDGTKVNIQLPKDVDYELFRKGAYPAVGLRSKSNVLDSILSKGTAVKSGLMKGDSILAINDQAINYYDEFKTILYKNKGKKIDFLVSRKGEEIEMPVEIDKDGTIGAIFNIEVKDLIGIEKSKTVNYSFGESIPFGWNRACTTLGDYTSQMKFVFTKKGASSLGGFATMSKLFPPTWNWEVFWLTTAFLSLVLAFMNLLPIPALDGGHVVFLLYEIVTGKEAPQKVLEIAQYVGIIILLSLMVFANGNDLYRWLTGG